ncbi:hypothetical protein [Lactovum odontotermitis]
MNQQPKESSKENDLKNEAQNAIQTDIKDFVQDKFFEKGNLKLKITEILLNLLFLAVLIIPIFLLFNSLADGSIWRDVYFWTYQDGFELSDYLESAIVLAVVVILVCSLGLLYRNNYREQKVYPHKKTYDVKKLEARKKILNDMQTKRFGEEKFRETARYYVVEPEQNLPDHMISDLFKKAGVEIK